MLNYLPNALTTLRLLLALPLGMLILRHEYQLALWVGLIAGITDALDGFAARRLNYFSPIGAALDPIADKLLILVTFICLANVALIDWALAVIVISRDLVIVGGALCYRLFIGSFDFGARPLSKINMVVQIFFCLLVLTSQLLPALPEELIFITTGAVFIIAIISGLDYIIAWTKKALQQRTEH